MWAGNAEMASASNFICDDFDLPRPGTGRESLACKSLRCRIKVDGLASLEEECDPVPSGVGTAV